MYDIIGDIHGHADELVELLKVLDYQQLHGVYHHPKSKVIFVGDFIDRGPKIRQVLEIVRPMVEKGTALAVMGNHEFNALAFHTEDPGVGGTYLRKRDNKNIRQHCRTILQLDDKQLVESLEWFRTLPLWLDLDGLRVVHACWDDRAMEVIAKAQTGGQITNSFLRSACQKGNTLYDAVEIVLKGKEVKLPEGCSFLDKDGHLRHHTRVRWFASAENQTYGTYALTDKIDCDMPLASSIVENAEPYPTNAEPVFIGHYWLSAERPQTLADNVACVDYSVAKGGFLCAYRWNGEQELDSEHFFWVPRERS